MTMTQRYAEMLRRHAGEMDATGTPPVKSEAIRQAARHMEDIARTLNSIARQWQPMKTAPRDGVVDANRAAKKATPHEQLIDELMDSTIPKTEREQAAAIEIEKNKDRIAAGHRLALELECLLLDTQDLPTVSRWWDSGIEALDEWQKLFPYNGPRIGD